MPLDKSLVGLPFDVQPTNRILHCVEAVRLPPRPQLKTMKTLANILPTHHCNERVTKQLYM